MENKPINLGPEAGFYESVSYTSSYGISEYLLFRKAYTNSIGAIAMPINGMLQRSIDWDINSCYQKKRTS